MVQQLAKAQSDTRDLALVQLFEAVEKDPAIMTITLADLMLTSISKVRPHCCRSFAEKHLVVSDQSQKLNVTTWNISYLSTAGDSRPDFCGEC